MAAPKNTTAGLSRRRFVASAATFSVASQSGKAQQRSQIIAYVGAYTDKGKGIHMFRMNPADGLLTPWKILTGIQSPSSLALHPNKKFLYACNAVNQFNGRRSGAVTALAIAPDGDLKVINAVSSGGTGPAHLGLHPTGRYIFVANYGDGTIAAIPVKADGSLSEPSDVKKIEAKDLGSQPAKSAPPGSFAISGHDAPHAHQASTDPSGKFVLLSDLGTDKIYVYRINLETGKLTEVSSVRTEEGNGPRHFVFSPNGKFLYSLNEEGSTVDAMTWNGETGELKIFQSLSTLPDGYEGTNYPSEIYVTPDGKFLYAANRLHDTIALFGLNAGDGRMKAISQTWTHGSYPRHFAVDPTGNYMYVLHSQSDNITSFRVNRKTGALTFTGKWYGVGNPSHIEFLTL